MFSRALQWSMKQVTFSSQYQKKFRNNAVLYELIFAPLIFVLALKLSKWLTHTIGLSLLICALFKSLTLTSVCKIQLTPPGLPSTRGCCRFYITVINRRKLSFWPKTVANWKKYDNPIVMTRTISDERWKSFHTGFRLFQVKTSHKYDNDG